MALVGSLRMVPAAASVLCSTAGGTLKLRAVCRATETQIAPASIGLQGATTGA